tara:strand:+ start:158 stop:331 length:174 start_codon:yes stop_codon:yes gene_type:complete
MYLKASKVWNIDKKKSFMTSDHKTDIECANKAKLKSFLFNQNNLYSLVNKIFKKINI